MPSRPRPALLLAIMIGCAHSPSGSATSSKVAVQRSLAASLGAAVPQPSVIPSDNDGDRVADDRDRCLHEDETWNGHEDEDGCPDEPPMILASFGSTPGAFFEADPGAATASLHRRGRASAHADADGFVFVAAAPRVALEPHRDPTSFGAVRRILAAGKLPPRPAIALDGFLHAVTYDKPATGDAPLALSVELGPCPWNPDHRLAHVLLQARLVDPPPRALVFLVDVSDSMRTSDRLPVVQRALTGLLDRLRPHDRFALAVYGSTSGRVLPLTPASERATITAAITTLTDGGSLAQGEGLPLAYALLADVPGDRSVVVLTDGDMGIGQRRKQLWNAHDLDAQVAPQLRVGTSLQVIDMGTDEPYAGPLLSAAGHGEHRRVTSPAELRRALDRITAGSRPVATAVKLDVAFDPARVRAYRQLGDDLFEHGPATRKRAPGFSLGSGEAATAVYELIPASPEDGPLLTITARASTPRARLELRQTLRKSRTQNPGSANFRLAAALTGLGLLLAERTPQDEARYTLLTALARGTITDASQDDRRELAALLADLQERHEDLEMSRAATSRWLHDNTPTPQALRSAGSLSTKSVQHLQRSAATLREFPTIRFEVTGHSDEREGATLEEREAIALTRARVIATYLVTVEGIDPDRLVLRSAGAREPIDASSSARGRALNRRVDFTVLVGGRDDPATR